LYAYNIQEKENLKGRRPRRRWEHNTEVDIKGMR
jgi:hypothetical protein